MDKMIIRDIEVSGKRVLVRVDFNVPLDKDRTEADDSRIQAVLPTIRYLISRGARVILISHLGRPKGKVVDKLRLNVVAHRLSQILGQQVGMARDCIGPEVEHSVARLQSGDVLLLENLRFHSGEEAGSTSFAQALARLADVFVNDAFGTSHRAHASIVEIANYLPAVAGLLLEKEVEALSLIRQNPAHPFAALLGGAKINDKVGMLEAIMEKVDCVLIGGAMAATFLKAKSCEVGQSLIEVDMLDTAVRLTAMAERKGVHLLLPADVVVADELSDKAKTEVVSVENIPADKRIVDIGPQTIRDFRKELRRCRTIFWNGPMGMYELSGFAKGTRTMVRFLAGLNATTVIGGGSTAEATIAMKLANKMTFVSTGGGASLQFLGGETLPGVKALLNKKLALDSDLELMKSVAKSSPSKIVVIVIDGLGGLPNPETGKTELETANIPNLDKLATKGVCGLSDPVSPGVTPGSAPAHLALFGYNPVSFNVGRGALETLGIDVDLRSDDVAARGNFCSVNEMGLVTNRRAGRISTEKCIELCQLLDGLVIEGIKVSVHPVREHRFIVVLRGDGLAADISDSDPQQIGVAPQVITAQSPGANKMARLANQFIAQAKTALAEHCPANMVLLRGFSRQPNLPTMGEIYQLKPAAIANYTMYRGLAKSVGMRILETGSTTEDIFASLKQNYANYDFFFLHVKETDSAGEDGDFNQKVRVIEQVDRAISSLTSLDPDVIVVTGDHSTPALLKGHSWHPLPVLLYSKWCRRDKISEFSESACVSGGLGRLSATRIMPLAMANALKLNTFGA